MKIDLRKVIIYVGIISVILSIICLINPQFNSFVKTSLIKFGDEISLEFAEKNTYRGFGIASGLFYDYGIILALFYTYCLYLKKYKEIWFFLLVPFLIVAILLNARTGIIVVGFSTIIYLLFKKTGFKFVGIELLLLFFFFASVYASLEEGSQLFIDNFFANVDDVFALGKDSDMSNVYFDKMIILPRSIDEWIIGRGYMIFGKTGESSDVGYIIQLNYGGLLFMALLLPVCVILIKKIKDPYFAVTTIIVMLIANLKGNFFFNSGCYRYLTFLILLESYLNSSNQNSNNIRRNYLNRKRAINNLNNEGISNKP